MAYQIKRHEAVIPKVGQIWEIYGLCSWEIVSILRVGTTDTAYKVVVADMCHPKAKRREVTMKYFQRKFQSANVWLPPRLQR